MERPGGARSSGAVGYAAGVVCDTVSARQGPAAGSQSMESCARGRCRTAEWTPPAPAQGKVSGTLCGGHWNHM